MSTGNDAHLGYWVDHSRRLLDKRQVLATDFWSTVMKSVVAVGLTLVAPSVYKIGKSFLIWLFDRHVVVRNVRDASPATIPLLSDHTHDATISGSNDALSHHQSQADAPSALQNGNSRDLESQNASLARGSERRIENADDFLSESRNNDKAVWIVWDRSLAVKAIVVITLVIFGLFVAQAIAGVFSAKIASDRAGLASSPHCGIWQFDDNAGEEAADRDDLGNYQKEARAGQYARTCYNSPDPNSPFTCRPFYNQSIKFDTFTRQPCPFPSSLLCSGGLYSAVTFDTGLVDASIIGINAAATHKFRRTATCSPLNMSEPYVISDDDDANDTAYRYYYGPKDDAGYTFNTSGRPFEWHVPVYSVNTYFSSLYPDSDYWRPLSELKPPMDSTLTIIFVSSMHIYRKNQALIPYSLRTSLSTSKTYANLSTTTPTLELKFLHV
ncbi:hypothetical protein N7G274_000483 [Stereocaulon virgatum]|uniref:Uncharacterized protein n=1 Tax=Stereocaulon virgatum TaxID=373712 RepID=A0ABR4AV14_9LECA